ncbi:Alpha-ketoglutarate-dependent dioxygenase alkB [Hyphodiscus hymeniophilus]|uniref:Alpha-ketoglutarate-dependent dioxygenase alkB n=1 Tax=Hyphodiscus hymeniophilus TaxID=353542 RepID=A0A9P7AW77_9HELO|nr:Alpha-ketoglutarate-dependent dioxygenase alkB [Hyphodiscus hymeniophilus]
MASNTKKRTLDAFFKPPQKKPRLSETEGSLEAREYGGKSSEQHVSLLLLEYPMLKTERIDRQLTSLPSTSGKAINDQADLDLLYFQPYIPRYLERDVFQFLRKELPFYRVEYKIKRYGVETDIRYTTVFGLDETSCFNEDGEVVHAKTGLPVKKDDYARYPPRPIPKCLDELRTSTEVATGCKFNFCLVNYYASGSDSISYHSDDERFLGPDPAIASFSLGAKRDFLMKHKPVPPNDNAPPPPETTPIKLPLASGDMILMKGRTQANWLHSIPKRTGKNADDGGRINITFRKAMVKGGTDNYYNYNVGTGPVFKWDSTSREMKLWKANSAST